MNEIKRHRTAIGRPEMSRPVRLALEAGLLRQETTFFDYGCGRGGDIRYLMAQGFEASGWDPGHRSEAGLQEADVVNLGYVINVVEAPSERVEAVKRAWSLAGKVLIVAARLTLEAKIDTHAVLGDGYITNRETFQKYYTQAELREWVDQALGEKSVAAAPGVFFVFRDKGLEEAYVASRYRRHRAAPRIRKSDQLYEAHSELLKALMSFIAERGRIPDVWELEEAKEIEAAFGSLKRAFGVIRVVTGSDEWEGIRDERIGELLIRFALDRFRGRPRLSELPRDIQVDVRVFFSTYTAACTKADELLFSVGDSNCVSEAIDAAGRGKVTRNSLYIHAEALHTLSPVLRVYEGCAREFAGAVEGANVIKLHRWTSKVSYLEYPGFDKEAHPALWKSLIVSLRERDMRSRVYAESPNPPILHRKEELLREDDVRRQKFSKLTRQEVKRGLFEEPNRIGRRDGWEEVLAEKGVRLRGHRLVRS